MKALVELAQAVAEGEKSQDVSELVQSAMDQYREETKSAASADIVALVRKIETHRQEQRLEIRRAKAKLKQIIAGLEDMDRRWAYAQSTNNFMPVLELFSLVNRDDLVNPADFDTLARVPADWKESPTK